MGRRPKYIDVGKLPAVNKIKVAINGKQTPFKIGDKLRFPEESPIVKTIISMTIFEDGTVNYMLKWFDGDGFKTEPVSLTDLKLLNLNFLPPPEISFSSEELEDADTDSDIVD